MSAVSKAIILSLVCTMPLAAEELKNNSSSQSTSTAARSSSQKAAEAAASDSGGLRLSLDEAIRRAVANNLGVRLQNYDYRISGEVARSAYGPFDPNAVASVNTQSQEQPVTSSIFSSQSEQTTANLGVEQFLPTGGFYSIGLNNSRQSSNSQFTTVNPAFTSGLNLAFNQPLARNFGIDVNTRGIRLARNNLGISKEQFRRGLIDTVFEVEQAYLDLLYARENIEVKRQSMVLARDQERITQIRIDVGASAPLDILQPRVAIATREEEVILAEAQIRNAEDRLRQLMNLELSEWDRPIYATDTIDERRNVSVNVDDAVKKALELRPELQQLDLGIQNREIEYRYARNQRLPKVDLNLNYGFAGLGGTVTELVTVPEGCQPGTPGCVTTRVVTQQNSLGKAFGQVFGAEFPSWTIGFNVAVPITNIGARAESKRAELNLERSRSDQDRVRQIIMVEVRQAARDIDTTAKQIDATRAAREAAEKNLDAEKKRYENGMTTNFNVLLIQQDLSNSRSRELLAQVSYNKSVANYHRAIGDLLDVHRIVVTLPDPGRMPRIPFESVRWLNSDRYYK